MLPIVSLLFQHPNSAFYSSLTTISAKIGVLDSCFRTLDSVLLSHLRSETCVLLQGALVIGAGVSFNNGKLDVCIVLAHLAQGEQKSVASGPSRCGRARVHVAHL